MDKPILLKGDTVRYTGAGLSAVRGKIGVIEANVQNSDEYVVDFGGSGYICKPDDLAKASFAGGNSGDDYMRHVERKWKTADEKGGRKGKPSKDAQ
jgi:hypothetical protein